MYWLLPSLLEKQAQTRSRGHAGLHTIWMSLAARRTGVKILAHRVVKVCLKRMRSEFHEFEEQKAQYS